MMHIVLFILCGAVCFLLIVFWILRGRAKGEAAVANKLRHLPSDRYLVLNDLMIKTSHGTSQIDHVVVSVYGFFVIETKDYYGVVEGSERATQWAQYANGKKYLFQNPLHQNFGHVKALQELTGCRRRDFFPIVVFTGKAKLHVQSFRPVVKLRRLKRIIRRESREIIFTRQEMQEWYEFLRSRDISGRRANRKHIRQIKKKQKKYARKIRHRRCPQCGARLHCYEGKYGEFLGCSRYPDCRFTYELDGKHR